MHCKKVKIDGVIYNTIQQACRAYDVDALKIRNSSQKSKRSMIELLFEEIENKKISEAAYYFLYGDWSVKL